jgi:hypothetical protein
MIGGGCSAESYCKLNFFAVSAPFPATVLLMVRFPVLGEGGDTFLVLVKDAICVASVTIFPVAPVLVEVYPSPE